MYFEKYGDPSVLRSRAEKSSDPGQGEVRVANRSIGVNPADWMVLAGIFRWHLSLGRHPVPGVESAGVVQAIGRGVDGLEVGDEVIRQGESNSYRCAGNYARNELIRKPAGLDVDQAATLSIAGGTAYSAIRQIRVGAADTVLIHAAAGGVGSAAVQIAGSFGARVIGTASERNHDYLRSLGAEPVAYGPGLVQRVRRLGPITAVLDAAGNPESVAATVELLPDLGRAVTALGNPHASAAGISGVHQAPDRVDAVLKLAVQGKLKFEISRMPLAQARLALERSVAGHVRGKIVLIP
jgi:NADPH:quinone reductase-like Zn-dependent oxidoreductase